MMARGREDPRGDGADAARARCGRGCRRWSSTRWPRSSSAATRARRPRSRDCTAFPARSARRSTTRSCTASRRRSACSRRATSSRSTSACGYKGYFTDSATTVAVGEVDAETKRLLEVTERSLAAGIAAARAGQSSRRHRRGGAASGRGGGLQRGARPRGPRHRRRSSTRSRRCRTTASRSAG